MATASGGLPKHLLVIKDCTFILPPDFNGNVEDAFDEFLKYRETNLNKATYADRLGLFSAFNLLLHSQHNSARVCGQYELYRFENGEYRLIDGTFPSSSDTPRNKRYKENEEEHEKQSSESDKESEDI